MEQSSRNYTACIDLNMDSHIKDKIIENLKSDFVIVNLLTDEENKSVFFAPEKPNINQVKNN